MYSFDASITKPLLDSEVPAKLETATFSMGWFWSPDARFGLVRGVYRTRVGYCGGTTENPTYHDLGDYMETIQIDFNPEEISYVQLLKLFWSNHSPEYKMASRQYMSAIHYNSEKQREEASESLEKQQAEHGTRLYTEVMPLERFYLAEAYHQKFYLQQVSVLKEELKSHYPEFKGFVDSTAAARVNGYVKGIGSMGQLMQEIDKLGLSDKARKRLMEIVDSYEA